MELMYPIAILICSIIAIIICFKNFYKKIKYTNGKKVANTKYIKESEYYKEKVRKYKIISNAIKGLSVTSIVITSILIARPVVVQTKSEDKYNRDILLGLDISLSESEVNLEFIQQFREILPSLEGDRIGIVIYNTVPLVYCPLTTDYDYIENCLDTIEEQLSYAVDNEEYVSGTYEVNGETHIAIWAGGVIANSEERGSSLVGDGLAGTIYSFPDLDTESDRTRIIIFATDNDVSGTEIISFEDACTLCKKYNINLYAYCPTVQMNEYTSKEKIASYKKAVEENADGKFYTGNLETMVKNIVQEIKETKTSILKTSEKTYVTDYPEIFFIIVVIIYFVLIIIERRVGI